MNKNDKTKLVSELEDLGLEERGGSNQLYNEWLENNERLEKVVDEDNKNTKADFIKGYEDYILRFIYFVGKFKVDLRKLMGTERVADKMFPDIMAMHEGLKFFGGYLYNDYSE